MSHEYDSNEQTAFQMTRVDLYIYKKNKNDGKIRLCISGRANEDFMSVSWNAGVWDGAASAIKIDLLIS